MGRRRHERHDRGLGAGGRLGHRRQSGECQECVERFHRSSRPADRLLSAETTDDHPHNHSHPHPYAEASTPPATSDEAEAAKIEDEEAAVLPTRLDRLIAFLDSYFGQVELIRPEELSTPPANGAPVPAADIDVKYVAEETAVKVEADESEPAEEVEDKAEAEAERKAAEERQQLEEERQRPKAPVIRVKLDEHWADVKVEDLVRLLVRARLEAR